MQKLSKIVTFQTGGSLYLSGVFPFNTWEVTLPEHKLYTIVSMISPEEVPQLPYPYRQIFFPIDDAVDANIAQFFDSIFPILWWTISRGENVLVHCRAGISRSVTVVIAFFLRAFKEGLHAELVCPFITRHPDEKWTDAILWFIRSKRPIANPNPGFMQQLDQYETMCLTTNHTCHRKLKQFYTTIN